MARAIGFYFQTGVRLIIQMDDDFIEGYLVGVSGEEDIQPITSDSEQSETVFWALGCMIIFFCLFALLFWGFVLVCSLILL